MNRRQPTIRVLQDTAGPEVHFKQRAFYFTDGRFVNSMTEGEPKVSMGLFVQRVALAGLQRKRIGYCESRAVGLRRLEKKAYPKLSLFHWRNHGDAKHDYATMPWIWKSLQFSRIQFVFTNILILFENSHLTLLGTKKVRNISYFI